MKKVIFLVSIEENKCTDIGMQQMWPGRDVKKLIRKNSIIVSRLLTPEWTVELSIGSFCMYLNEPP